MYDLAILLLVREPFLMCSPTYYIYYDKTRTVLIKYALKIENLLRQYAFSNQAMPYSCENSAIQLLALFCYDCDLYVFLFPTNRRNAIISYRSAKPLETLKRHLISNSSLSVSSIKRPHKPSPPALRTSRYIYKNHMDKYLLS